MVRQLAATLVTMSALAFSGCGGIVVLDETGGAGGARTTSSSKGSSGVTTHGSTAASETATNTVAVSASEATTGVESTGATTSACDSGMMGSPSALWCKSCTLCAQNGPCTSTIDACQGDPECVAYYQCFQVCPNQASCAECGTQHPEGKVGYDAIVHCFKCACIGDCGTNPATCN